MTRRVTKAFEAWEPSIGIVAILNTGAVLTGISVVFDRSVGPQSPLLRRAVEFRCGWTLYCAAFDRFEECTVAPELAGMEPR